MWIFWTIILSVVAILLLLYSWTGDGLQGAAGMWSIIFMATAITILNSHINPKPTALDVYRGNTELMVTSVNGVPTDTVVVFKNK